MYGFDKEEYLISLLKQKEIGDDGAVIGESVYSMDAFNEDIHFKREWMSMRQIGTKAMLVNISDAIAMNANPKYALLSISLPRDISRSDIEILMKSMSSTAAKYGCKIIGGDTTAGSKLNISITLISKSQNPLMRDQIQEGDLLAYTGTLGESKKDLDLLFTGEKIPQDSRFYLPSLRGSFIKESRELITSGMDISDGLFCDTNKILDINKYGILILKDIPQNIGSSGEEYEMLISFNIKNKDILEKLADKHGTTLTTFAQTTTANNFRYPCESHHF